MAQVNFLELEDRIYRLECMVAQLRADITTNRQYDKWLMNLPSVEQQVEQRLKRQHIHAIEQLYKEK